VTVAFGPPFDITVTGEPRARSTVAAAAEQIRLRLKDHLDTVSSRAA
jgi:hypothetical protein